MNKNGRTPLRYPGGKSKLYYFISKLIKLNFHVKPVYVEPFAGGAGLALKLLFNDDVSDILINDYDLSIWAFWDTVLNRPLELIRLIESANLDISEWKKQKQIYLTKDPKDITKLGFATLYLNRTNRSGIILANPIGGINQTGNYLMSCRFNKSKLIEQIMNIYSLRDRIHLTNEDAKDFIIRIDRELNNSLFYLDPPYVQKGHQLYKNSFKEVDHTEIRDAVTQLRNHWMITYDDCEFIEEMYIDYSQRKFDLSYTVQTKRVGSEIAIFSRHIMNIPDFK